ncbi:autocrine proliferation repressor protein A-like [Branchiostoma floridae x Branchiostoma belcheri]
MYCPIMSPEEDVDRTIWWHWLTVTVPDNITHPEAAFLFLDEGSNDNPESLPSHHDNFISLAQMFAVSTGSVGANLKQIPNQHILFKKDPLQKRRSEDSLLAYSWRLFLDHPDQPDWLIWNAMTKASVRAMDTVQDFVKKNNRSQPEKFLVSGASKRGWTTWLTGAVDKRVFALAPIVFDLLNLRKNLHHYYRSLGGWPFAFGPYYDVNITGRCDDPSLETMAAIADPLAYKDRLTMPKYLTGTGGDEFFLPDNSYFYWDQLEGEKYRRWIPNAEHSCAGHEISILFGLRAFFFSILEDSPRPKLTWTRETGPRSGKITLQTNAEPVIIRSFHARTLDGVRRDFRLLNQPPGEKDPQPHPVVWLPEEVEDMGNGTYVAEFDFPDVGWLAFFIQTTFPAPHGTVLEFTTEVHVIPDTFPFPECHGDDCRGVIV